MNFRNYKRLAVCGLAIALSACGLFSKDKVQLDGERIAVLRESAMLAPDFEANEVKIKLPKPHTNTKWSQTGGNSIHMMGHLQAGSKLKKFWKSGFGEGNSKRDYLLAAPVIAYNVVFTIDADAEVRAFRLDDGDEIWSKRVKPLNKDERDVSMKGAGLAEFNHKIYVTTGFGGVFALDMKTGKQIWRFDEPSPIRIAPTVAAGKVFVQTIENSLIALDAENGKELWRYKTSTEATTLVGGASPAYDPEQDVVIAAFSTGELRAFKASTGSSLWSDLLVTRRRTNTLANINGIKASPVIDGDVVYALGHSNILTAIDLRSGNRIWEREIGGINQPWIAGKYLYVLSSDFDLIAMEKSSGKIVWNTNIPVNIDEDNRAGLFANGPVLTSNRLIVSTSNGYVFAVSPYDGKILGYITLSDGVEVSPVVAGGITVFTTNDADIIAYK